MNLSELRPGDVIRHRRYSEYAARVIRVGARIDALMVEDPDPNLNDRHVSLDRGDVENLWRLDAHS